MTDVQKCPHCRKEFTEEEVKEMELWDAFDLSCKKEIEKIRKFSQRFGWLCIAYVVSIVMISDHVSTQTSIGLGISCFGALVLALSVVARADKQKNRLFQEFKTRYENQQSGT